ncbi:M57 family metalloprotease [Poritiphilus flavus]|uniref:Peptidase n=1 Tax=Poritiphilus flavus TaxID=2697053 RepID=A0A6L9E8L2_9FLAO|nr:M57 family metalloprotease [Poritiphilus flavus]NAS11117.1 peptidase [Poritiphilus flavus]
MKILKTPTILCLLALFLWSCQDEVAEPFESTVPESNEQAEPLEVTEEVVRLLKTNYFNSGEIEVIGFYLPDGSVEQRYLIEGDISFSKDQLEALATLKTPDSRNYHTNNLVNPRTLTIIGYTGGQFALSSKERTALQWSVNNYNRLNLGIRFSLSFGTNFQDKDMVVYYNPNESGSGGVAGFPSNGNPNKFIQIYGLDGFSTNVNEHVITHEMGHSVGFRHTDWQTRQSCGDNINEGVGSVGANPIPGTPAGYDPTSLMLACFSSSEDGEFNNNDIIALNYLY